MPAQPLTYPAAIDTLFGLVNTNWAAVVAAAAVGYTPIIRWQGREEPSKPPVDQIWARVSAQIVTDNQASLANTVGQRLFHAKGLLYIQLFCPRTVDLTIARLFAQLLREVFRVNSPNMWFSNQKIVELAPTTAYYPITVSASYEYDSIS